MHQQHHQEVTRTTPSRTLFHHPFHKTLRVRQKSDKWPRGELAHIALSAVSPVSVCISCGDVGGCLAWPVKCVLERFVTCIHFIFGFWNGLGKGEVYKLFAISVFVFVLVSCGMIFSKKRFANPITTWKRQIRHGGREGKTE